MVVRVESFAKFELRSVIPYMTAESNRPPNIYLKTKAVYGDIYFCDNI
jgi:hypothetical protein